MTTTTGVTRAGDGRPRLSGVGAALLAVTGGVALARALSRRRRYSFDGKTVLITGGSRGLGLALARCFASEGAQLVLAARNRSELDGAVRMLQAEGCRSVEAVVCDVRDPDEIDRTVQWIQTHFGGVDVLVNNAGVIQMMPFAHAQLDDFSDSLDTHFWGPLYLIRACLPYMGHRRAGRIINISSIGGRLSIPHFLPYAVGKFALTGLSEGLHAELRPLGIRVTNRDPAPDANGFAPQCPRPRPAPQGGRRIRARLGDAAHVAQRGSGRRPDRGRCASRAGTLDARDPGTGRRDSSRARSGTRR
jgi:NAD(P)-dependent dehydrogenase (short-subunit alcohol dehydrogenase family)